MSGTGWTCTLATLTCTRTDALAAGANYPAIALTVNVAADAPASVTNIATVSGGGETNTANDTAADVTAIAPVRSAPIPPARAPGTFPAAGGPGTVTVTAGAGCSWTRLEPSRLGDFDRSGRRFRKRRRRAHRGARIRARRAPATSPSPGVSVTVQQAGAAAPASRFVPVTPCRIADTRNADGPFGGPVAWRPAPPAPSPSRRAPAASRHRPGLLAERHRGAAGPALLSSLCGPPARTSPSSPR